MADSEVVQQQLGEAAAEIETAILIMNARREETLALVDTGAPIPPEWVVRNRRDIAFAVWQTRRGVERLAELAGARAVYDTEPLQSLWRDVVTISTHAAVARHLAMVPSGRLLLGLPPPGGGVRRRAFVCRSRSLPVISRLARRPDGAGVLP